MTASGSFAGLLRQHRHEAGLTLEQLSERSGVSARAISNMELGHSLGPQRKTIESIAGSLGLVDQDRAALLTAAEAGRQRVFAPAPAVLAMPCGVSDFVGRASEVSYLAGLMHPPRSGPAPVVVVSGSPGVGKTSFAVHAAAALAGTFLDGQLFVDLRGLDERPLEPKVLLGRLINAIAPGQRDIPHDEVERAGLYRTLLTDRRVLIVLDDAADEAQVRMLLPGAGASLMLITSRRRLTGIDTAHRLSLVPLSQVYAVQMLTNLMGREAAADRGTVAHLAGLGGNLPLALRLIGNRLAGHGGTSPQRFVQRLSDTERRLENLTAGDVRISAVFTTSYVQLSDEAQRLFRRLSLAPGEDTGPPMAAVLADAPLESTELALDELVEYGLLQSRFADRYRLHDLIRLFARARLGETESAADIARIRERVESWLLATATVAGRWFEPGFGSLPPDWDDRVPLETSALAQQWIESEADNWLGALRDAAAGRRRGTPVRGRGRGGRGDARVFRSLAALGPVDRGLPPGQCRRRRTRRRTGHRHAAELPVLGARRLRRRQRRGDRDRATRLRGGGIRRRAEPAGLGAQLPGRRAFRRGRHHGGADRGAAGVAAVRAGR